MKEPWLEKILRLGPAERARIAQIIWESIEELPEPNALSEDQMAELVRRLSDFEKKGSDGRPWREVISDIGST